MTLASVKVLPAKSGEMRELAPLILEMLAFYEVVPPLSADVFAETLERDGPADRGEYECLIARDEAGTPLGFTMYSTVYEAAFAGNGVFLRDIYVTDLARGKGVAKAMMIALAETCVAQEIRRIDWHAARLDLDVRTFFEMMAPDSFKLNRLSYRIEDSEIHRLAGRGKT